METTYVTKAKIKPIIINSVLLISVLFVLSNKAYAQNNDSVTIASLESQIRIRAAEIEKKMIGWREDIHQHPELGDAEMRTSKIVADQLNHLGMEVTTGVARTGVIGILKGGKPGATIALRADMDALPVKEPEGLSFASKAMGTMRGQQVNVMHACGHDTHTAMLMAAAEVLSGMKQDIPGTIMFIFQPAEEGSSIVDPTTGDIWGAQLILKEGWFKKVKPEAVFALHVMVGPSGAIFFKSGATTAGSENFTLKVSGRGGHGGMPWSTIDPVPTAALIVSGLQTTVSRKADLTKSPAVVTVATLQAGSNPNVIPDSVFMSGTIRSYDKDFQNKLDSDVTLTAEKIAESQGGIAKITITPNYPATINDSKLADQMSPVLKRVSNNVSESPLQGASEDFSFYAKEIPGLFIFLGITPKDQDPATAAPNHNPHFFVDETALITGIRAMASMTINYLVSAANTKKNK
ncbi:amidohydrolase [Danxiaibacter flavus]|uniref:Amidohydrolase n=1 Tax=Danxiaibacter flavus TaxID=3049108 RepID=A0ABV3ZIB8_9BACT|nr:amidohydrolase [Chitinophagaceae bacterium DXS]